MEAIWKKQYSLAPFLDAGEFKTYEELNSRLNYVLGNKGTPRFQDQETVEEEEQFRHENRGEAAPMPQSMRNELNSLSDGRDFNIPDNSDDEDDTLSYFQRLAES